MAILNFNVNGVGSSVTKTELKARNFSFIVDEPEALGGKDEGANPVEYILAGYAGCLNVVLNMVAKEQGISISHLRFDVNGELDPSKLFGKPDSGRAGFRNIFVTIDVESDAGEEEIQALLNETKRRCPVNDNLSNVTPISYSIKQIKNTVRAPQ